MDGLYIETDDHKLIRGAKDFKGLEHALLHMAQQHQHAGVTP